VAKAMQGHRLVRQKERKEAANKRGRRDNAGCLATGEKRRGTEKGRGTRKEGLRP
jgi:hypothetical protein